MKNEQSEKPLVIKIVIGVLLGLLILNFMPFMAIFS
ncbi:hypothetical protein LMUR_09809 [Listeria grayi FSL F6-1183]|uniref:Uncharacterized protein n=1 Tax=Listeria grayi FSL F6-1183 TaxID=1265827 RepID=A0A829R741_LISGR|nr:hypothetical protein LMUR_09809 [Listeria grayi FSL F6-1183]